MMGTTLEGQMNALDIEVSGVYNTGIADTNDKFLKIPLKLAAAGIETEKKTFFC